MYRTLGAHPDVVDGAAGTRFAVWAPNAADVSVVCNANGWKPGQNRLWGSDSGIWAGFVPGMKHGDVYKYIIRSRDGRSLEKSDPVAFYAEVPPRTASIVYQLPNFPWQDGSWMHKRAHTNWFERPISIYEVHLGSWRRPKDGRRYLSYRELAQQLVDYTHEMGYTHLQLMPLCEFPYDGSWGYQTTGYFAPTSRFGTPEDFMHFVDYCHQADVGVIIDWVPAHFPCDGHALGHFDGTSLYEHSDPRQGMHPDWGTYIFNYDRSEVRDFLLSSARFWLETYHVDGLRVDAVASMLYLDYSRKAGEWIPNRYGGRENLAAIQFLKDLNVHLHGAFPGVLTIAEESTAWGGVSAPVYNGGLGFSMKWDMGWMNDTLRYLRHEPVHRKFHQNDLSFRMVYAFTENFILPLSHDEVVHGKRSLISQMPGDYWQQFASLRLLYGYQYTMPGKKLLFMGGEFGQWTEWNYDAELDWALFGHKYHDSLRRYVGDLNRVYRSEPALYEIDFRSEGFRWIQADDYQNSVYAYYRIAKDPNDIVVVLENFTPVPRQAYRVGVPRAGCYRELINSDAAIYGGSNLGNSGAVYTEPIPAHGHAQSLSLTVPPLAMLMLKPV
jgi:1,4-alpha-glucan branching enzyme